MRKVIVKQPAPPQEPVPFEVLATSIRDLARFGEKIKASKLKDRVILILLKDLTGIPMADAEKILDALPQLERKYLK